MSAQLKKTSKWRRALDSWVPHQWGWIIPGAFVFVLSFPHWDIWPLIFPSLVPWLWVIHAQNGATRREIAAGILFSFLVTLGGFYWVAHALTVYGDLPWPVGVLGLGLFGLFNQTQWVVYSVALPRVSRRLLLQPTLGRNLAHLILASFLYTGIDWLIPKLFLDTLGHSLHAAKILRQAADLAGPHGLTFLIYFFNHALWMMIDRLKKRGEPSIWPALRMSAPGFVLALLMVASTALYGINRLNWVNTQIAQSRQGPNPNTFVFGVIQANIGDFEKLAAEKGVYYAAEGVVDSYTTLTDFSINKTPRPDFIVWPETAYPSAFRTPYTPRELARDQRIVEYVRSRRTPLLFGGYDHVNRKDYNSLFYLTPEPLPELGGKDLLVYHKSILLLFGEYIPGAEIFPIIKRTFPQVGNFGTGQGAEVLEVKAPTGRKLKLSPVICYEALFPQYSIDAARKGSQLILNVTNDSWFGAYGEPYLHLALTKFRSIETRLPQLRATNTGVSTLILPDGEATEPTAVMTSTVLQAVVPIFDSEPTLMIRWGNWFGPLALVLALLGSLPLVFFRTGRHRDTRDLGLGDTTHRR